MDITPRRRPRDRDRRGSAGRARSARSSIATSSRPTSSSPGRPREDHGLRPGQAAARPADRRVAAGRRRRPIGRADLSQSGTPGGTAAYMSPEQARGEPLDNRIDLFSLGAVLYEMVTGQRAFKGTTPALIFDGILNRIPEPPTRVNPGVPAALERVIEKAMEKDRALRYQHAADLVADLRRVKRALESGTLALLAAPRLPARRTVLLTSLVAAVALGILAYVLVAQRQRPAAPLTEKDSIVLGEIANKTGDPVFDGTLTTGAHRSARPVAVSRHCARRTDCGRLTARGPPTGGTADARRRAQCLRAARRRGGNRWIPDPARPALCGDADRGGLPGRQRRSPRSRSTPKARSACSRRSAT